MANLYNSLPIMGVVEVDPAKVIYNGLPVIGVRVDAGLFTDNKKTLGVQFLTDGATLHNDQRVSGVVTIADARNMFNGFEVIPVSIVA